MLVHSPQTNLYMKIIYMGQYWGMGGRRGDSMGGMPLRVGGSNVFSVGQSFLSMAEIFFRMAKIFIGISQFFLT